MVHDEIFQNPICNIEIISGLNILKKKNPNILSCVFFKNKDYRKNFAIYVKGLKNLLYYTENRKKNTSLLIFIDDNINNDNDVMRMINNFTSCVVLKFKCSEYLNGIYHCDLFGTLVRMFPLFDFPNNFFKKVVIVDIDLHTEDYYKLTMLLNNDVPGVTCSSALTDYLYDDKPPYAYANMICYNKEKKLDKKIFIDFVKNAGKIKSIGRYGKRNTTFGFGIDEIFINEILLPMIGEFNSIIEYQICYFIYLSKHRILEPKNQNISSAILSAILGPFDTIDSKIQNKWFNASDLVYNVREKNGLTQEISARFNEVIKLLASHKKYWLEKRVQDFITKYLMNLISACVVVKYNFKDHKIMSVDLLNPIYIDEYNNNLSDVITSSVNVDMIISD
jgi:hypothetical protein